MKTLIALSLLVFCVLGVMTAPAAAQASGPHCLFIAELEEVAQFFALPTGGGQAILTGQSLTFDDAYTGSGYVTGNDFVFSLASGVLPGLLEGIISLTTGTGVGSVTFADTGQMLAATYSILPPPCAPR
jgi:hypothetical protein